MKGSVRQRSKGTWQLRYDAPPDRTGKRKFVSATVKGNKKDADRILRERLSAIETGGYVARQNETVAEFFSRWLQDYASTNTTLKTQQGYKGVVCRHIIPGLGKIKIQNLTSDRIQSLYSDMQSRSVGTPTILAAHRVLKEALSHAVEWRVINHNPADATKPPRLERKTMPMWNVSEINEFLSKVSENHLFPAYHLAVLTGLRRSELFGLKWDSIDLIGSALRVIRTLQRITGHQLVEGQPKTARSRRSVSLPPSAVELLHRIRGTQIEQQLQYGGLWDNSGYVFTNPDGSPIDPDRISKEFPKLVKAHGLPHLTFHSLRHAHATLALTAGINPKIVSERLGHSSVAVTMDIYSHVLPGMQEEAALAVENLLERA